MPVFTTAKTKVYISAASIADKDSDFIAGDFSAVSWTEIGGTLDLGTIGDKASVITSERIAIERTKKGKGTRNSGSMTISCALDYSNAGQVAVLAAEKTRDNYAFKVEFDDAPSGGTPSTRQFIGLVMSAEDVYGGANDEKKLTIGIEINSNIVKVNAAA